MKRTRWLVGSLVTAGLVGGLLVSQATAGGEPALRVEVLRSGLVHPWAMTFLPDGSMLYTQRDAKTVTLRTPSGAESTVLSDQKGMWSGGETGLMGIERANDFATTGRFFTCHGYRDASVQDVRVVAWRLDLKTKRATFVRRLVTGLPTTSGRHGGCALLRGDGHQLFVGTGDAATGTTPQSLVSGGGKVLRVDDRTGAGYAGNPWITSQFAMKRRIWTYGHRNVQGLTRRPTGGPVWSVEHGSDRDDEVNVQVAGGNYGWNPRPRQAGDPSYNEGANSPMTDTSLPGVQRQAAWSSGSPTIAPSGASFVNGSAWGPLNGALAMSVLKGQELLFLTFSSSHRLVSTYKPAELDGTYGRLRAARRGLDGALYVTTSNGSDDKILRITPAAM